MRGRAALALGLALFVGAPGASRAGASRPFSSRPARPLSRLSRSERHERDNSSADGSADGSANGSADGWADGSADGSADASALTSAVFPDGRLTRAPTTAERRAARELVASTRAQLSAWENVTDARADGYQGDPAQLGIMHLINPARLITAGQALDPRRPSALVYVQTAKGFRLAGAMFMMDRPGVAGPDLGGPLTPWHAHRDCRGPLGVSVPTAGVPCPAGTTAEFSAEMLHVWKAGLPDPFTTDMDPYALVCVIH